MTRDPQRGPAGRRVRRRRGGPGAAGRPRPGAGRPPVDADDRAGRRGGVPRTGLAPVPDLLRLRDRPRARRRAADLPRPGRRTGRVAATWTPHPSVAADWHEYRDATREVGHAVTWAALDCAGGWAADIGERLMVLGTMTARLDSLPAVGEEHVVVGEARGESGRKRMSAASLYDAVRPAGRHRRARLDRGRPGGVQLSAVRTSPWWRHAVTYQVYVRSFADSDGDGVGDLPGITSRLPYLRDLGVDALWITPFYTSPQHDHGYDVADYCDVDPLFGTLADADELVAAAHELGLKVIVDLVPNHTSSEHAWFQAALASPPGSPERARYLFRDGRGPDGDEPPNNWRSVFGGAGVDAGARRPVVPAPLRHHPARPRLAQPRGGRHVRGGPALLAGPRRRRLPGRRGARPAQGGVAARPGAVRRARSPAAASTSPARWSQPVHRDEPMWDQPEVHDVYRRWHRVLADYPGDRMTVAEAWTQSPESMARYVRSDEMSQAFNFAWLLAPWSATAFAERHRAAPSSSSPRSTPRRRGCSATTTWSGTRRGTAAARSASPAPGPPRWRCSRCRGRRTSTRARSSVSRTSTSPPEARQDPAWLRTRDASSGGTAAGCRSRGRATRRRTASAPAPASPGCPSRRTGRTAPSRPQDADPESTLAFYRAALAARREHARDATETVELLDAGDDVLAFTRGAADGGAQRRRRCGRAARRRGRASRAGSSRAGCCRPTPRSGSVADRAQALSAAL